MYAIRSYYADGVSSFRFILFYSPLLPYFRDLPPVLFMREYERKLFDSSRAIADMLTDDIGQHPERFEEMLVLCFRDEYPLSMRAARIVALCTERHPFLAHPHVSRLISELPTLKTEGVRRGILKMLLDAHPPLHEDDLGLLTDLCFRWLANPKEAMAVRYYCIES